jgi:hypothetical protein
MRGILEAKNLPESNDCVVEVHGEHDKDGLTSLTVGKSAASYLTYVTGTALTLVVSAILF